MLKIFKRKVECHFFLPSNFSFSDYNLSTDNIKILLRNHNFKFRKIKSQKVGCFLYFVSVFCVTEDEMNIFKDQMIKFKDLVPPWIAFPYLFQGSPRWNQGFEEYYGNVWMDFFKTLSIKDKESYLLKYDCPKEWEQWFKEANYL